MIELLVVISIIGILGLLTVPLASGWVSSAQVNESKTKVFQAYGMAKSLALRNPSKAVSGTPSAGIKLAAGEILVCAGDPTAAACATNGASTVWKAALPTGVSIVLNGTNTSMTNVGLDNSGFALNASSYQVTKGGEVDTLLLR